MSDIEERERIIQVGAMALCGEACDHHQADVERVLSRIGYFELRRAAKDILGNVEAELRFDRDGRLDRKAVADLRGALDLPKERTR